MIMPSGDASAASYRAARQRDAPRVAKCSATDKSGAYAGVCKINTPFT